MDLGAGVCTPKRPACVALSARRRCAAHAARRREERFPVKAAKTDRPTRLRRRLRRRARGRRDPAPPPPDDGLLGGMAEVPGTEWLPEFAVFSMADAEEDAPFHAEWERLDRHHRPRLHAFPPGA